MIRLTPDLLRGLVSLVGLAVLFLGLWLVSPPAALAVTGFLLFVSAEYATATAKRKG